MTRVFLSGSRSISRLDGVIIGRVNAMTEENCDIVVGDANGADKALQKYLKEIKYPHVTVFYSGEVCRNKLDDSWAEKKVEVNSKKKDWNFYVKKDRIMASEADSGFVLWNGRSAGSVNNILELMKNNERKFVDIYFQPKKRIFKFSDLQAVLNFLRERCDRQHYDAIKRKVPMIGDSNFELTSHSF